MESGAKSLKAADESVAGVVNGFDLLSGDLLHNILVRLPAASFAHAACVNRSWNQVCSRFFSRPKFASAISLNPSLEDAVEEVVDRVLSAPIRPHFAIVSVSPNFTIQRAHRVLHRRLGIKTPIITSGARGIIGRLAVNNEFKEVQWDEDELECGGGQRGICLFVGFIPGVKVDAIPCLRSGKKSIVSLYEDFVHDVREFSTTTSGSPSPAAIMIFGEQDSNVRSIIEKIDYAMPLGTVIVGSAHGSFLYESSRSSSYAHQRRDGFSMCVALVFARDIHKSQDIGETHFHVTISDGLRPLGNMYKAVSVRTPGVAKSSTWLTAKRDGSSEVLDGYSMVHDIDDETENNNGCRDLFTGIIKHRKQSVGMERPLPVTTLSFHGVSGFNEEHLFLDGLGIRTGDSFQFYTSDPIAAQSSLSNIAEELRKLKDNWTCQHCSPSGSNADIAAKTEVCCGFVFACCGRGEWFFEKPNVDSSPLLDTFPEILVAGMFCDGEIGRGCNSSTTSGVQGTPRCPLHVYSSVYLVVSHSPVVLQH